MIFAGLGSPIGRAVGMGFAAPVTESEMDRLEEFYFSRKAPAQVDYCPLTDISLLEIASRRGYGIAELNNVLVRPLKATESFAAPAGVVIRPGAAEEVPIMAAILQRAFFPSGGAPNGFDDMVSPHFSFPGSVPYVAVADGRVVACGAGLVVAEHRIVALFGAGTIPEFRGRGLQTALLQARMAQAARDRCEFAVVVTQGGTTSQRNAERLGFRVVYSKATLIKQPPAIS
jgi:ribosomal protein S18 acetylase RimI-like enzyme